MPGNLYSQSFISTFLPRNRTPSLSSRKRCSKPSSPGREILPPEPITRCHGSPLTWRRTCATCRAQRGYPAAAAMPPYVLTLPRGIRRIMAAIATAILDIPWDFRWPAGLMREVR